MFGGDNSYSTLGAKPNEINWLTNYFTSLYKKEIAQKLQLWTRNGNVDSHTESIEKYLKLINVTDELGKTCVLLDCGDQSIKDELMFEEDDEVNCLLLLGILKN